MNQEKVIHIIKRLCENYRNGSCNTSTSGELTPYIDHCNLYKTHISNSSLMGDSMVPPEYRKTFSKEGKITRTPPGDVYCLLTYVFSVATKKKVPKNFQLTKQGQRILEDSCRNWEKEKREAFIELFNKGTKVYPKNRIQSIDELMKTEEYLKLTVA